MQILYQRQTVGNFNTTQSMSFKPFLQVLFYVLDYWRQQFIGERTRILDAWITILFGELRGPFQYFNYYSSELLILRSALINIK